MFPLQDLKPQSRLFPSIFEMLLAPSDSVSDSRPVVCIKTLNMDGIMMSLQMEPIGTD